MRSFFASLAFFVLLPITDSCAATPQSKTFGLPAEAFVTGCELVLFGDEIAPMVHNDREGYWVVKTPSSVTVNGITLESLLLPKQTPPARPVPAEIRKSSEVIQAAVEAVRRSRETHKGIVVLEGKVRHVGDQFTLAIPSHNTNVSVKLYDSSMDIVYENFTANFQMERPTPQPQAELDEIRLDGAYTALVRALRPGRFVVAGEVYTYSFPLARATEIRAALTEIRAKAEVQFTDPYLGPSYKPIKIGDVMFASEAIRDFVKK